MAKNINEIFATNKQLLDTPEVKELVAQFKEQFNLMKITKAQYWQAVTDITMNSELFVINGTPCKDAIEEINKISFGKFII